MLKKTKSRAFGKDVYLLGMDADGTYYWLQAATWDCDWYWGGGYVECFTNNKNPAAAKDITYHSHFDSLIFNDPRKNCLDTIKQLFVETPFTDDELFKILELMKSFYTARAYSDMIHMGGSHFTANPAKDVIRNDEEYKRINEVVIPAIMQELYRIMEE